MGRLLLSKDTNRAVKTNPFRLLSLMLLVGCLREPVEWGDVTYRSSKLGDPDARSAIMSANLPTIPGTAAPCLRSIRTVGSDKDLFRVWWSSRSDSTVLLSMQHSPDLGATWQDAVVVESRDTGRRGCDRPEPGIFSDSKSGYVFLVYFIEATDGAGVFFAHSMDKGRMFHSPVPVVYGNAPSHASVAANGDSVVAVFEDPNSTTSRIGIVLSRTSGHIFEQRGQATPDDVQAIKPWLKLDHDKITVWWKDGGSGEGVDRVGSRAGIWR
ncbi:MAG TPA: hypothetical protein VM166_06990 [Gemmatimonadaceae bacterium]|nr:hypothetical protein [Gemmatimonadaceae bacterium]